jgi:hypothetical protein
MDARATQAIEAIQALSLDSSTPYDILVQKAHALLPLAPLSICQICEIGQHFYRGTSYHTAVPTHEREISYPSAEHVQTFGRANPPGKPVFYCSTDPDGVFRELRSRVGQYAVLAKWVTTRSAYLHGIGYSGTVFERANAQRQTPDHYRELDARLDETGRVVRDFLALEFTKSIDSNYRLTAAIAEVFLAGDDISGIVYPTIAKNCNSDNVALLPAFVDSGLRLVDAEVVLIDSVGADGAIGGRVVARLATVADGRLTWEYSGNSSLHLPPNTAAVMRVSPGRPARAQQAGTIVIDGLTYELRPGYTIDIVEGEVCVRDLQSTPIKPVHGPPRRTAIWPEAYGDKVHEYLARFKRLFATATTTVEKSGFQMAISVCFRVVLTIQGEVWKADMIEGGGIEIHDAVIPAERIAWSAFIHDMLSDANAAGPVGIIVEAFPGTLDALNARTETIRGQLYLPDGFELVYGCRGCENEYVNNAALAFCRTEADGILRRIQTEEIPELRDTVASDLFSRCRRFAFGSSGSEGR